MNKADKALSELGDMDQMASGDSPLHRLSPITKFLVTVAYIVTVVSFDKYDLGGITVMLLWPVLLYQIAGISVFTCFYKLRIVLPLVLAVGLFNPILDRAPVIYLGTVAVSGGVLSMISLMLKGTQCLMASFLLMATTPVDSLCAGLRKLRFPQLIVTLLLLTYRYAGVLTGELSVMTDAYHLRAPRQKGIDISAWGSFLGQLLLRSMDRAQSLYESMLLRGYDGSFHYAGTDRFGISQLLLTAGCIALFIILRTTDIAGLIGGIVMR